MQTVQSQPTSMNGFQTISGYQTGVQQMGYQEVVERIPVHKVEYQEVRRQVPVTVPVQQVQLQPVHPLRGMSQAAPATPSPAPIHVNRSALERASQRPPAGHVARVLMLK